MSGNVTPVVQKSPSKKLKELKQTDVVEQKVPNVIKIAQHKNKTINQSQKCITEPITESPRKICLSPTTINNVFSQMSSTKNSKQSKQKPIKLKVIEHKTI